MLSPATQRVIAFFEALAPEHLDRLGEIYRDDATFRDPFHAVRGVDAVARIFHHMFATLDAPRFEILDALDGDARCLLTWNFHYRRGRHSGLIHGASRIEFDRAGLIRQHHDYWDAAESFYEKLPLLGSLLRAIRRRMSTNSGAWIGDSAVDRTGVRVADLGQEPEPASSARSGSVVVRRPATAPVGTEKATLPSFAPPPGLSARGAAQADHAEAPRRLVAHDR